MAVTMGYGHLRPAYNLRHLAVGSVISADNYKGIPENDRKTWEKLRKAYEFVSRFKRIPIIGEGLFELMDELQEIASFYPRRNLARPIWQLKATLATIKKGWGRHLIGELNRRPLPLIATFFTVAHMAEYWGYRGPIYCIATDTDISRAWVPVNPSQSRIKYCAPTYRVAERLKLYGVPPRNIFLTGFPLPKENIGLDTDLTILQHDLARRIINLDPARRYLKVHSTHIKERLHLKRLPLQANHPLTLTFAVGGAGAQREIGAAIVKNLRQRIIARQMRVNLIAGINEEVRDYFTSHIEKQGLGSALDTAVRVLFTKTKEEYFVEFNKWLRTTDILWTKPSELSFYTALGLPIIIAPPIGSQEEYNRAWLLTLDAGVPQEDPDFVSEWLSDWLRSGFLAKAAMSGYREAFKFGTFNIERLVENKPEEIKIVQTVSPY